MLHHYATEGIFVVPTFVVVCAIVWLAERFAWSDESISAAMTTWLVVWGSVVFFRGEWIVSRFLAARSKREKPE